MLAEKPEVPRLLGSTVVLRPPRVQDVEDRLQLGLGPEIQRMYGVALAPSGPTRRADPPSRAECVKGQELDELVRVADAGLQLGVAQHAAEFIEQGRVVTISKKPGSAATSTAPGGPPHPTPDTMFVSRKRGSRHLPGRVDRLVHGGWVESSFSGTFTHLLRQASQFLASLGTHELLQRHPTRPG